MVAHEMRFVNVKIRTIDQKSGFYLQTGIARRLANPIRTPHLTAGRSPISRCYRIVCAASVESVYSGVAKMPKKIMPATVMVSAALKPPLVLSGTSSPSARSTYATFKTTR